MKYRLQTNIVIYQIIAQMIERREKCLKLDYKQLHELHAKWSEKNVFDSKNCIQFPFICNNFEFDLNTWIIALWIG